MLLLLLLPNSFLNFWGRNENLWIKTPSKRHTFFVLFLDQDKIGSKIVKFVLLIKDQKQCQNLTPHNFFFCILPDKISLLSHLYLAYGSIWSHLYLAYGTVWSIQGFLLHPYYYVKKPLKRQFTIVEPNLLVYIIEINLDLVIWWSCKYFLRD